MAKRPPSPVKLKCFQPWKSFGDDMKVCKWVCPRGGATVQFRNRDRPEWFAVLHPSTKQKGKWQLSTFDDRGAIGDVIRSSCEEALYDGGIDRHWKIEEIGREGLGLLKGRRGPLRGRRAAKIQRISISKIFAWTPKVNDTIVDVNEGRTSRSTHEPVKVSQLDTPRGGYWIIDGHHRVVEAVKRGDSTIDVVVDEHLPRVERTGGAYRDVLNNRVNVSSYLRSRRR